MRRGVFSSEARRDIAQAWDYISAENLGAAIELIGNIEQALRRLCRLPNIGHTRSDVKNHHYRFWVVRPYVIAYRFNARTLTVVRLLHGRRDFRRLFG